MTDAEYIAMENSTIVRSAKEPWLLPLIRAGNRVFSAVAPSQAARAAERRFLRPSRRRRPAAEIELLARARARPMRVGERRIEVWTWGSGPSVLLVHGWGGRGAQLGAFVDPLVASGFAVVTFDAPGHGAAGRGEVTVSEIVAAIHQVAAAGAPLAGLIAHSMGAVTATLALTEGLQVGALGFIAPATDLRGAADRFVETLGYSRAVGEAMRERIARRVGRPWSALDVTGLAPALRAPLLVVHDRDDAEVPWQHGVALSRAWADSELLLTDALGHRRILRDPDVVAAVVAFIAARTAERRLTPRADADLVESLPALAW
jgi:pimeloyl-ACP methyl ester carboxylesterase